MLPEEEGVPCVKRCVTLNNVTLRYVRSRQIKLNTFERGNVNTKRMRDICSCSKIEPWNF